MAIARFLGREFDGNVEKIIGPPTRFRFGGLLGGEPPVNVRERFGGWPCVETS